MCIFYNSKIQKSARGEGLIQPLYVLCKMNKPKTVFVLPSVPHAKHVKSRTSTKLVSNCHMRFESGCIVCYTYMYEYVANAIKGLLQPQEEKNTLKFHS